MELAARPYYKNLYNAKPTKSEAQIKALDPINKIIPPELRKTPAKPLSQNEIENAIEGLAKGKAPGSYVLSIDFYKKFSGLLTPLLHQLHTQSSLQTGSLTSNYKIFHHFLTTQKEREK